jgi:malonyl CoA-acyl carrier protein transacylase
MEPQFKDVSDEITRNVTEAVTRNVTEAVTRNVTEAVTRNVTAAVTAAVNNHVTQVVTAAEQRLAHQAKLNVEAVKEVARLAAEGYVASLDAIDRRLATIETKLTIRVDDHDSILENHNERISSLERKRRAR